MTASTAAICRHVLSLPNALADITTPACVAPSRSTVTASSRVMMTIATHAASRCRDTSEISAATISSLSASGSISLPKVGIESRARGRQPGAGRSSSMNRRTLGPNGPEVSEIGLGCMGMSAFYGATDEGEARRTIQRALDEGCNFLDTADMYGPYTNERLLGGAIAGRREEVFLATKFGIKLIK